jgi:hypothetical protein
VGVGGAGPAADVAEQEHLLPARSDQKGVQVVGPAVLPGTSPLYLAGGHLVVGSGRQVSVIDALTGQSLLDFDAGKAPNVTLSPDGRFAKATDQEKRGTFDVYSVDTGAHASFEGDASDYGWTSDGQVFSIGGDGVEVCSASSGDCSTTALPAGVSLDGDLRLLGLTYES